jgi:hypothetical protein
VSSGYLPEGQRADAARPDAARRRRSGVADAGGCPAAGHRLVRRRASRRLAAVPLAAPLALRRLPRRRRRSWRAATGLDDTQRSQQWTIDRESGLLTHWQVDGVEQLLTRCATSLCARRWTTTSASAKWSASIPTPGSSAGKRRAVRPQRALRAVRRPAPGP